MASELKMARGGSVHFSLMGRPHVVILGAGASRAACPAGDANGRQVPLMRELTNALGLEAEFTEAGLNAFEFEASYDACASRPHLHTLAREIERRARSYFADLTLPEVPTVYDYLVWGLRHKDFIATFNWDPFLYQALKRNSWGSVQPQFGFLHGSVAFERCMDHKWYFERGMKCSRCAKQPEPFPILYPVAAKDYESDPMIAQEWHNVRLGLKHAYYVTIFGYSAPQTDVAARRIFVDAWKENRSPELTEVEFINTSPEHQVRAAWDELLQDPPRGRVHYSVSDSLQYSPIFQHPRRSCEELWSRTMMLQPFRQNPFPEDLSLEDLQYWGQQLLDQETEADGEYEKEITDQPCRWPI